MVLTFGVSAVPAQTESASREKNQADEILQALNEKGRITPELLSKYPRATIIRSFSLEQKHSTGFRSGQIAYVLAALGHDYSYNRNVLTTTLKGCAKTPNALECTEEVAGYLCNLFDRGDTQLLEPLLTAGLHSDGALAELLGSFFSELVVKNPRLFISYLSKRPVKQQRQLAWLAGASDGSGMSPAEIHKVRVKLLRLESKGGTIAETARLCLFEIRRANSSHKP